MATVPFSGFQRAEPFGGYEVEKKSGESFLLGKVSFARAFRNAIDKGSRGFVLRTIEVFCIFFKKMWTNLYYVRTWLQVLEL